MLELYDYGVGLIIFGFIILIISIILYLSNPRIHFWLLYFILFILFLIIIGFILIIIDAVYYKSNVDEVIVIS
jgi:hypothetical protein